MATRPLHHFLAPTLLALAACSTAAQAATYTMYKDPNCGCCDNWADHVREDMELKSPSIKAPTWPRSRTSTQFLRNCAPATR